MTLSRKIPLPESGSADRAPPARLERERRAPGVVGRSGTGDLAQFTGLAPQKVNCPLKRGRSIGGLAPRRGADHSVTPLPGTPTAWHAGAQDGRLNVSIAAAHAGQTVRRRAVRGSAAGGVVPGATPTASANDATRRPRRRVGPTGALGAVPPPGGRKREGPSPGWAETAAGGLGSAKPTRARPEGMRLPEVRRQRHGPPMSGIPGGPPNRQRVSPTAAAGCAGGSLAAGEGAGGLRGCPRWPRQVRGYRGGAARPLPAGSV